MNLNVTQYFTVHAKPRLKDGGRDGVQMRPCFEKDSFVLIVDGNV